MILLLVPKYWVKSPTAKPDLSIFPGPGIPSYPLRALGGNIMGRSTGSNPKINCNVLLDGVWKKNTKLLVFSGNNQVFTPLNRCDMGLSEICTGQQVRQQFQSSILGSKWRDGSYVIKSSGGVFAKKIGVFHQQRLVHKQKRLELNERLDFYQPNISLANNLWCFCKEMRRYVGSGHQSLDASPGRDEQNHHRLIVHRLISTMSNRLTMD